MLLLTLAMPLGTSVEYAASRDSSGSGVSKKSKDIVPKDGVDGAFAKSIMREDESGVPQSCCGRRRVIGSTKVRVKEDVPKRHGSD